MTRRIYRSPPIEEALCELRFVGSAEWDFTVLASLHEELKGSYPGKSRTQTVMETDIRQDHQEGGTALRFMQGPNRVQFPTIDGKQLIGVAQDVLSVHVLRPYPGWEAFRLKIEEALAAYRKVAKPTAVRRIGLRYINKVELPGHEPLDVSDYFSSPPSFPDGFSGKMVNFITRREFIYDDQPIQLALTFASAQAPQDKFAFLLDLDMSWEGKVSSLPLDNALEKVDELRAREREAFELLITDRTREIFDGA